MLNGPVSLVVMMSRTVFFLDRLRWQCALSARFIQSIQTSGAGILLSFFEDCVFDFFRRGLIFSSSRFGRFTASVDTLPAPTSEGKRSTCSESGFEDFQPKSVSGASLEESTKCVPFGRLPELLEMLVACGVACFGGSCVLGGSLGAS